MSRFNNPLVLACAWTLVLVGCSSPKGDDRGRVPISETTESERRSSGMVVADLVSASDDVAQALIKDMDRMIHEHFRDPSVRIWVTFGAIENKSRTMPASDFETMRERVKDKVQHSSLWRDNIKFVANYRKTDKRQKEEFPDDEDDLMQGGQERRVERPEDKANFYTLEGYAGSILRGSTEYYYMNFTLKRISDGEEIFTQQYEVKYDKDKPSKRDRRN